MTREQKDQLAILIRLARFKRKLSPYDVRGIPIEIRKAAMESAGIFITDTRKPK